MPKSPIRLREALPEVLENVNENLTPRMRNLVAMLWSEWKDLELQIAEMNDEVERIASSDEACRSDGVLGSVTMTQRRGTRVSGRAASMPKGRRAVPEPS